MRELGIRGADSKTTQGHQDDDTSHREWRSAGLRPCPPAVPLLSVATGSGSPISPTSQPWPGPRLPRLRDRRLEPQGRRLVDARRPEEWSSPSTRSGWRSSASRKPARPASSTTQTAARNTRASPSARRCKVGRDLADQNIGSPRRRLRQRLVREAFFATLETELIHRAHIHEPRRGRARRLPVDEGFYNPRRRHSSLDMLSPIDYEQRHQQEAIAA